MLNSEAVANAWWHQNSSLLGYVLDIVEEAWDAHDDATDDVLGSEVATIPPEAVAEEALGSRETPSQQDPKVTCEDTQDLDLVKSSPEDVSYRNLIVLM